MAKAKASRPQKFVILFNSDTHSNHVLGLTPPSFSLKGGDTHLALRSQQFWQWPSWLAYADRARQVIHENKGAKVISVFHGDLGELDIKDRTTALISRNPVDALNLMVRAHAPVVDLCDRVYVIKGTEAHVGKDCWIEEIWAKEIGAEPYITDNPNLGYDDNKIYARWSMLMEWGGVLFDISHHERFPGRPWTDAAASQATEQIIASADNGERIPNLVIRGHGHTNIDSHDRFRSCRFVGTLGWQMSGVDGADISHLRRVSTIVKPAPIGGVIVVAEGGKYTLEKVYFDPPKRKIEVWNED